VRGRRRPLARRARLSRDETARVGLEPLALCDPGLTGFVRVVTHPRVFAESTPTPIALDFVDELASSPAAVRVAPGERHWRIFADLCEKTDVAGNLVPDASREMASGSSTRTADMSSA
jgi:predicted nucleic acid-binding protein